jgi:hypothetical protein
MLKRLKNVNVEDEKHTQIFSQKRSEIITQSLLKVLVEFVSQEGK